MTITHDLVEKFVDDLTPRVRQKALDDVVAALIAGGHEEAANYLLGRLPALTRK